MNSSTTEYEAKLLDVDPEGVTEALELLGATKVADRRLMRRYVYDIVPGDMSAWMRLRHDGERATLTIKKIHHDGVDGTVEWEQEVADFHLMNDMLALLGFEYRNYQENYRTSWTFKEVQIEIDEWPRIRPYVEIEGPSELSVQLMEMALRKAASGIDVWLGKTTSINTTTIYSDAGIDLLSIRELRF